MYVDYNILFQTYSFLPSLNIHKNLKLHFYVLNMIFWTVKLFL